jgi:hypothetical protein
MCLLPAQQLVLCKTLVWLEDIPLEIIHLGVGRPVVLHLFRSVTLSFAQRLYMS